MNVLSFERARRGRSAARDAAITLLALTTGLRACDIVNLRLADIDWRGQTIGIVPLDQLLPDARSAHERPHDDDHEPTSDVVTLAA